METNRPGEKVHRGTVTDILAVMLEWLGPENKSTFFNCFEGGNYHVPLIRMFVQNKDSQFSTNFAVNLNEILWNLMLEVN